MAFSVALCGCHALLAFDPAQERDLPGSDRGETGADNGAGDAARDDTGVFVDARLDADADAPTDANGTIDAAPASDAGVAIPTWHTGPDYPEALGAMGATAVGNVIHIMGGDKSYYGSRGDPQYPSRSHRRYDNATGTYTPRADTLDGYQWGPRAIGHAGYIYSFGGWFSGGRLMRRYDPATNTWTYRAESDRTHLYGFACAEVGDVIYAIAGGIDDNSNATRQVSAYDILANSWSTKSKFPAEAFGLAGAAIGTKIYVVGRDDNLDIYDTVTNQWSTGPSIGYDAKHAAVAVHGGSLYVFGPGPSRRAPAGRNDVHRFDPSTETWRSLPPMPTPRVHPAVAVVDNEIHLFGGLTEWEWDVPVKTHEYLEIPSP